MSGELELFTLHDKYMLMFLAILILTFSVGLFVWLESLDEMKKIQIKSKRIIILYISIFTILLILSSIFIAKPFVENKTIKVENVLSEALIDNENVIMLTPIENAYYPTFNGNNISWYTKEFKDQRYLQSKKVSEIYICSQRKIYELDNDSRLLSIEQPEKPVEIRGTEVQSFWYSLVFVVYNIFIAIIVFPLFTVYKIYIKLLWKSQNIISILLLAIMISETFIF